MKHLKTILEVFKLTYHKILASPKYYALPLLALLVILRKLVTNNAAADKIIRTGLSDFLDKLKSGDVTKVFLKRNKLFFFDKSNSLFQTTHYLFPKT